MNESATGTTTIWVGPSHTNLGQWLERLRTTPIADRERVLRSLAGDDHDLIDRVLEDARENDALAATLASVDSDASAPTSASAGDRLGGITLLRIVGAGASSVVWHGRAMPPLARDVAVKWIRFRPGTIGGRRFEDECDALARMNTPTIAQVYAAGLTPTGNPFIVMELVEGETITAFADRHRLSIAERCALFAQVCDAIQHAHGKSVVHRDIAPKNILVTTTGGGEPVPKVIDFGIALLADGASAGGTSPTSERAIGTLPYMSPEQTGAGRVVDARSDVYGLASVLYELLAGSPPFQEDALRALSSGARLEMIRAQVPEAASERARVAPNVVSLAACRRTTPKRLVAALRRDLDGLVSKGLAKEPADRYQTAESLGADLRRYVRGEPLVALPGGAWSRTWKFARRHRVLVTGATAAALLLMATATIAAVQARRAIVAEARLRVQVQAVLELTRFMNGGLDVLLRAVPSQTDARHSRLARIAAAVEIIAAQQPENRSLQVEQAQSLLRLGEVLGDPGVQNRGDTDRAIVALERAEAIAKTIAQDDRRAGKADTTEHAELLMLLGEIRLSRGRVDSARGHDGAVDWHRSAHDAFRQVVDRSPSHMKARMQLAYADKLTCSTLAAIRVVQIRLAEQRSDPVLRAQADATLRRAQDIARGAAEAEDALPPPEDLDSMVLEATALQTIAEAFVSAEVPNRAEEFLDRAASRYRTLLLKAPDSPGVREGFGSNRRYAANLAEQRGEFDKATMLRREAMDAYEQVLRVEKFRPASLRGICLVWRDQVALDDRRGPIDAAITSGEQQILAARRMRDADPSDKSGVAQLFGALADQSERIERFLRDGVADAQTREAVRIAAMALIDETLALAGEHASIGNDATQAVVEELGARRQQLTAQE